MSVPGERRAAEGRADEAVSLYDAPPPAPPEDDLEAALARLPAIEPATAADATAIRAYLERGREVIRALHEAGAAGRTVVRLHSQLMDRLLAALWQALQGEGEAAGLALVALGGYGRSELAPFSDVDLLLLHRPERQAEMAGLAEAVLYRLWDAGQRVGHAVRTPAQCVEIAEADHTARTALLDCRYVAGDRRLYDRFERSLFGELHSRRVEHFLNDKLGEWRARHGRFGQTVFRLEPDVKSGEGGLRDLHTALWIARVVYHAAGLSQLARRGLLPPSEVGLLRAARDFLWRVRNALHYRAGRATDLLTFDMQEAIAEDFGYREVVLREGKRHLAVERFMRDYYLSARTVLRLSRQLIDRAVLERRLGPYSAARGRRVAPGLKVWHGRLTLEDPGRLLREPAELIGLFEVADREGVGLYGYARDAIRAALPKLDPSWRESPSVQAAFRRLVTRPGTRGDFLFEMHETGVLGALVPEFGRQTGLWQHDLYHTYTVDVHSLFAVKKLYGLRRGEIGTAGFREAMGDLEGDLYTLVLGTWFHDIGKGLGGGHAERGARMMPRVCRRLGCTAEEAADVEWLVRMHLVMSRISQRRDLSDPELIRSFAESVGSLARLKLLYVLTYVDVSTTGEHTWTDWKASLLRELYEKTRAWLEAKGRSGGRAVASGGARQAARRRIEAKLAGRFSQAEIDAFLEAVPERYLLAGASRKAALHLSLLRRRERTGLPQLRRVQHPAKGFTELLLAATDRAGLLADLTGVLAAHRVNILGAHIFSLRDGSVLDVFLVRDSGGGPIRDRRRWAAIEADLRSAALGEPRPGQAAGSRGGTAPMAPRPEPGVRAEVRFDDAASPRATVVDVFARDRLGLLHAITRAITQAGLQVEVALVATEGHRATDAFYVTTKTGEKLQDPGARAALRAAILEAVEGV
ncbi:MAG: [protein-PII] uridylyltransferase [Deltaproteobacteria bacterium]|nr:MAG: [protein-PII] uridylyltransferase [Deltaproteobacteria bacterium]